MSSAGSSDDLKEPLLMEGSSSSGADDKLSRLREDSLKVEGDDEKGRDCNDLRRAETGPALANDDTELESSEQDPTAERHDDDEEEDDGSTPRGSVGEQEEAGVLLQSLEQYVSTVSAANNCNAFLNRMSGPAQVYLLGKGQSIGLPVLFLFTFLLMPAMMMWKIVLIGNLVVLWLLVVVFPLPHPPHSGDEQTQQQIEVHFKSLVPMACCLAFVVVLKTVRLFWGDTWMVFPMIANLAWMALVMYGKKRSDSMKHRAVLVVFAILSPFAFVFFFLFLLVFTFAAPCWVPLAIVNWNSDRNNPTTGGSATIRSLAVRVLPAFSIQGFKQMEQDYREEQQESEEQDEAVLERQIARLGQTPVDNDSNHQHEKPPFGLLAFLVVLSVVSLVASFITLLKDYFPATQYKPMV